MNIKLRLIALSFLQFFVWGSWLTTFGVYLGSTLHFQGPEIGNIFGTLGIAAMFMPAIMGIIADKFVNAEKLLGVSHLVGAALLYLASTVTDYPTLYIIMLFNSVAYMPTIALSNSVSYNALEKNKMDIFKSFPPIRVWGTIGFIAAMWTTDLMGWTASKGQLYLSAGASIILGLYSFTMPKRIPGKSAGAKSFASSVGLDALVLFQSRRMATFFIFSMFLGAALQITNIFGVPFLSSFQGAYPDSFSVKHPNMLASISQISETLFILTIPFFLGRFGIKNVMWFSIIAWVLRFGLFGFGNPGDGFVLLVLSMIVYGMAFDFFNISGSLFVEREANPQIRASAQGLFMLMTNGIGAFFGGTISGWVVGHFTKNGVTDWHNTWLSFAGYALVLAVLFPLMFKYKHGKNDKMNELAH